MICIAWFISDNHFNHKNIIKYCSRPFENIKEMDEYMIKQWNSVVNEGDLIYHLGDFALGLSTEEYIELVNNLHGQIILIRGNHDRKGKTFLKRVGFIEVQKKLIIGHYILSHRPQDESQIPEGFTNIHGHIHNYKYKENTDENKYINVSVEMNDYKPIWIDI
jgi:calcineurin-like phosphoesterase family protein